MGNRLNRSSNWTIRTKNGYGYMVRVNRFNNSFFTYSFGVVKCDKEITREVVRKKLEELEDGKKEI